MHRGVSATKGAGSSGASQSTSSPNQAVVPNRWSKAGTVATAAAIRPGSARPGRPGPEGGQHRDVRGDAERGVRVQAGTVRADDGLGPGTGTTNPLSRPVRAGHTCGCSARMAAEPWTARVRSTSARPWEAASSAASAVRSLPSKCGWVSTRPGLSTWQP